MEDGMPAQTEEQRYEMTQEIMQAVVAMYADTKDQELVRDAGKSVGHQRKMTSGERRNEVVNAIRELAGQAKQKQQQLGEQQASALIPAQKEEQQSEIHRVDQSINRMTQENNGLREQISAAEAQALDIGAKEQHVRQQESVDVPRARHMISLYANISSIRWDYGSENLKGFITSADGNGIRAFELDKKENTDFAIANQLWELMDA